jgi:uncharacterized protein YgfB (UPF0149 family)
MEPKYSLPDYDDVADALVEIKNMVTPAQMHGLICGVICLGETALDEQASIAIAIGFEQEEVQLAPEQSQTLKALLDYSHDRLSQMEFDFQLLLPDDDRSLRERSEELGCWCSGFLLGLESLKQKDELSEQLSVDGFDTLLKLSEIAQIDYEDLSYSEYDETALMEITEYVRMAILTLYSEFHRHVITSRTIH